MLEPALRWNVGPDHDSVAILDSGAPDIIRVALVDDHTLLLNALCQLLDAQPDFEVVAGAGDAWGALEAARLHQPDVMVLDVDLPGPGAIATVKALREERPTMSILMLSMYDNPSTIRALLELGVRGYLLKSCSDGELYAAIRKVATDPRHVVLSVTARLFETQRDDASVRLSRRELQVLSGAADALSNRQIANRLGVTEATVKRHLHNVFTKLDASSRIDAVNKAKAARLFRIAPDEAPAG